MYNHACIRGTEALPSVAPRSQSAKGLAYMFIEMKKRNKYDEFLHKVQHPKVRELWDNPEDEVWDNV